MVVVAAAVVEEVAATEEAVAPGVCWLHSHGVCRLQHMNSSCSKDQGLILFRTRRQLWYFFFLSVPFVWGIHTSIPFPGSLSTLLYSHGDYSTYAVQRIKVPFVNSPRDQSDW